MKKLLWIIGGVLVVAVAGVLVGPGLIDWNKYKQDIQAQAKAAIGRELLINGDISLTVLPAPALIVKDVSLANIKGAASKDMVRLKSLEVRIALAPLLGGQIKVERVKLVDPVIRLEVLADGRRNWIFDTGSVGESPGNAADIPPPEGTPAGQEQQQASAPPVALDNVTIVNGTLIYTDPTSGVSERAENINATFAAASLTGPFESVGGMKLRGLPFSYDLNVGAIIYGRTVPFNLKLGMSPGKTTLRMNGTVVGIGSTPRIKGRVKVEGESLAALIQAVRRGALPGPLGQSFSLEASVSAGADSAEVKGMNVRLGTTQASGEVTVALGKTVSVAVRLGANRIDLDQWLALPEISAGAVPAGPGSEGKPGAGTATAATPSGAGAGNGNGNGEAAALSQPEGINGSLAFTAEALTYRNGVIRNAVVNAELTNGEITLSQLSAQFPGGSDLALFGFVTMTKGKPRFEGELETTVNDFRGVLRWLGTDLDGVSPDRLRKLTLATRVTAGSEYVQLTGLDLQFDSSRLTGGVTVALTRRPSFGADITLNRLNLDAYLPKAGLSKPGQKAQPDGKAGAAAKTAGNEAKAAKAANPLEALKVLTGFDANLKARVKALTFRGNAVKNALFDGTLYNGDLEIRRLSVSQVAESSLSLSGALKGLGATPTASGLTFKVVSGNVQRLLGFAGVDAPALLKGLGPVSASGRLDGPLLAPRFKVKLTGAGATASLDGQIDGLALVPTVKKLTIKITAKNAARLLQLAGADAGMAKRLGPVSVAGMVDGNLLQPTITLNLNAAGGTVALAGKLNTLPVGAMADLSLNLRHPDLARLIRTLSPGYRPAGRIGGLDLKARLLGGSKEVSLSGLSLTAGAVSLNGDVVVGLAGARPDIRAKLTAGPIVIDPFLPAKKSASLRGSPWPGLRIIPAATHRASSRWSTDAIDLSGLSGIDASVALKSPSLQYDQYKLQNADLVLSLGNGRLSADKLTGVLFGGALQATASATTTARPRLEAVVALENMNVGEATRALTGKSSASGRMGLRANLKSSGASVADLISGLSGTGSIRLKGIDVKKGNTGTMLAGALGLVSALNQFGGLLGGGGGKGAGLVDISGSFDIRGGVARSRDMKVVSSMGNGAAQGFIDLPRWRIDVSGNVQLSQNLLTSLLSRGTRRDMTQSVPFRVRGRLDAPSINLDTSKLTGGGLPIPGADRLLKKLPKGIGGILQGILGGGGQPQPTTTGGTATGNEPPPPQPQQQPQQQQQQTIDPVDLLRGLFKRR